jgi:hypothetical protein
MSATSSAAAADGLCRIAEKFQWTDEHIAHFKAGIMKVALNPAELRLIVDALDESLLLDHLAGLEKALQSYRGERVIFHGPSEFLARTGKKLGHGTQVGVKASRLCVNQLVNRAARIIGEVLSVNSYQFSFGQ